MTRVQTERLIDTVKRVFHNVPFIGGKCKKRVLSQGYKVFRRFEKVPFTYKQDLRDTYPWAF